LVCDLDPSAGDVEVDSGQIEQVLMNLAVNARDAMPQGGTLSIETRNVEADEAYAASHASMPPGAYVMLSVADTGCGMDEATQSRIFDPFFTTKSVGKSTGLGLATVYGIVKQSNGYIWVYSEPGVGTVFKIYFPRTTKAKQAPPVDSRPARQPKGGTRTILVVDDSPEVRGVVCRILEKQGYVVLEATRGSEAIELARAHAGGIDLIVSDVVMPETNAAALTEQVHTWCPNARVLFMSGYSDEVVMDYGVIRAGDSFLQKPFTIDDLLGKVNEVLDAGNSA
jgi:CheY-like chemotaxis protein